MYFVYNLFIRSYFYRDTLLASIQHREGIGVYMNPMEGARAKHSKGRVNYICKVASE